MQYDVLLPKKILRFYQVAGVILVLLIIFALLSSFKVCWICTTYFQLMCVGFFLSSYLTFRKNKIAQAKQASKILLRKTTEQLAAHQQQLLVEQKKLKILHIEQEKELAAIADAWNAHANQILQMRSDSIKEERSERWHKKKRYQEAHVNRLLQNALVVEANLPGIGDHSLQCLRAYSVRCAADVSRIRIRSIKGFGERKIDTLVVWRNTIEQNARKTQPNQLPDKVLVRLEKKYKNQHQEIDKEELAGQTRLMDALNDIHESKAYDLYAQYSKTKKIKESIAHLKNILEDMETRSVQFKKVTLHDYVLKNFFRLFTSQRVSV